jgi:hypothetical protein
VNPELEIWLIEHNVEAHMAAVKHDPLSAELAEELIFGILGHQTCYISI